MLRLLPLILTFAVLPFTLVHAQLNSDPDRIETENGALVIHPILHGSVVFEWNGMNVYADPWGDAALYEGKGSPDLILITVII